jgi:hypothetical protein
MGSQKKQTISKWVDRHAFGCITPSVALRSQPWKWRSRQIAPPGRVPGIGEIELRAQVRTGSIDINLKMKPHFATESK